MKASKSRIGLLAILAVGLIVALLMAAFRATAPRTRSLERTQPDPSLEAREAVDSRATGEAHPAERVEVPAVRDASFVASEPRGAGSFEGRVLDATYLVPVVAHVSPDVGGSVFSRAEDGGFELGADAQSFRSLEVTAPGYSSRTVSRVDWTAEGSRVILLEASGLSGIVVVYDDGRPAVGLPVVWRADPLPRHYRELIDVLDSGSEPSITTMTNGEGRSTHDLAVPVVAVVTDPALGVRKSLRIRPFEVVRVVLPRSPLRLRFVALGTGDPIRGLELEAWSPVELDSIATMASTNQDGVVGLAAARLPLLVRPAASGGLLGRFVPLSGTDGLTVSAETVLRIDSPSTSEPFVIGVEDCATVLILRDDVTNELIDTVAAVRTTRASNCAQDGQAVGFCTLMTARGEGRSWAPTYPVIGGRLRLPCRTRESDESESEASSERVLLLSVAGYRPERLAFGSLFDEAGSSPAEVRLQPASPRSLRVSHADGTPFIHSVEIYLPSGDILAWRDPGRPDGLHGPFDWTGGDLWIGVNKERGWPRRISALECASTEVLEVVLPEATGAIEIEGIPAGYPVASLIAKFDLTKGDEIHSPVSLDAGSCRFAPLSPGSYLVGPRDWVLGAERHGLGARGLGAVKDESPRAEVEPGRTTIVQWRTFWAAGRSVEGRVRLRGPSQGEFVLIPLYMPFEGPPLSESLGGPRMIFGRATESVPHDEDGRYGFDADAALPVVMAVCVLTEGGWGQGGYQVLETTRPGEDIEVPLAGIELRWGGSPAGEPVPVSFEVPADSLRHPVATFHQLRRLSWVTSRTLRIEDVPLTVSVLKVGRQTFPLELAAGEVVTIEASDGPTDSGR